MLDSIVIETTLNASKISSLSTQFRKGIVTLRPPSCVSWWHGQTVEMPKMSERQVRDSPKGPSTLRRVSLRLAAGPAAVALDTPRVDPGPGMVLSESERPVSRAALDPIQP